MSCKEVLQKQQWLLINFLEKNHELLNEKQQDYIIKQINELEAQLDAIDYN